jgi:hypothetical protein
MLPPKAPSGLSRERALAILGQLVRALSAESAVRAGLNELAEVVEHRRPEQSFWGSGGSITIGVAALKARVGGVAFEAEGPARRSIESAAVVSAWHAAVPGSAGTLPTGG